MRRALLLTAAAAALLAVPAARADGDPASDVLLGQDVFLPYAAQMPPSLGRKIESAVQAANTSGYRLKVAIIAGRADLGLVQALWLKPKRYAPFLGRELQFVYKGKLVVEMPNGFGVFSVSGGVEREQRIVDSVSIAPGVRGLGEAMLVALERLSPAAGATGGGGSETLDRVLIGVGAGVLLAALVLAGKIVRDRRSAQLRAEE